MSIVGRYVQSLRSSSLNPDLIGEERNVYSRVLSWFLSLSHLLLLFVLAER